MSVEEYDRKIRSIKKELSFYSPQSILRQVLGQMHWAQSDENVQTGMPWIVLFFLKLGMLEGKSTGREMSRQEFNILVNRLFRMQHLACPIEFGGFELKLRSMFLNQFFYQRTIPEQIKSLARQSKLFSGDNKEYSKRFSEAFGISINDFYNISMYFVAIVGLGAKGLISVNLYQMVLSLTPAVNIVTLANYLLLVGVRSEDLPTFFAGHKLKFELNQQSEYFQPTPLKWKPIILDGEEVIIFNVELFLSAIGMLMPGLMKNLPGWDFKGHFGRDFELYVGGFLSEVGIPFKNEDDLKAIFRAESMRGGKVADFLVSEGASNLIVECKAIERSDIVSSVFETEVLRKNLEESFLKSIVQCQSTAFRLSKVKSYDGKKFQAVVVTHEDFWISSAADFERYIDAGLSERLIVEYKYLPIPLTEILFLDVNTWESMLASIAHLDVELSVLVDDCAKALTTPEGRRFTASQAMNERLSKRVYGVHSLTEHAKSWLTWFEATVESNKKIWQGKAVALVDVRNRLLRYLHARFDEAKAD